jgi:hypothetical protein
VKGTAKRISFVRKSKKEGRKRDEGTRGEYIYIHYGAEEQETAPSSCTSPGLPLLAPPRLRSALVGCGCGGGCGCLPPSARSSRTGTPPSRSHRKGLPRAFWRLTTCVLSSISCTAVAA